jgi:hypothetical protein
MGHGRDLRLCGVLFYWNFAGFVGLLSGGGRGTPQGGDEKNQDGNRNLSAPIQHKTFRRGESG